LSEGESARGYLLDTHTALRALGRPEALSAEARNAASKGPNVLSVVSYWEVIVKSMKGTLDVGDPRVWWREALEQLAATVLQLRPGHVSALSGLLAIHKDPFDRMLIAQAMTEDLALVTANKRIALYAAAGLRVVK
jgi:PIN domain nuclease of toxin-antitoxin system